MHDVPGALTRPELVAHRGDARRYPENTLAAIRAALEQGARYVEMDVQLSADGVPVVFHDDTTDRITGSGGAVTGLTLAQLRVLEAGERTRFGDRFLGTSIPTLAEAADLLAGWPEATAFIEIKPHSLGRFGLAFTVERVWDALTPVRPRCVIICYDADAVAHARGLGAAAVGWVLPEWTAATLQRALSLLPDYLFCDHVLLPPGTEPLWAGPWRWAVYEVEHAEHALALAARGAHLIETTAYAELRDGLGGGPADA